MDCYQEVRKAEAHPGVPANQPSSFTEAEDDERLQESDKVLWYSDQQAGAAAHSYHTLISCALRVMCRAQVHAEHVDLSHRQGAPTMEISFLCCGKQHCQTFTPEGIRSSWKWTDSNSHLNCPAFPGDKDVCLLGCVLTRHVWERRARTSLVSASKMLQTQGGPNSCYLCFAKESGFKEMKSFVLEICVVLQQT